MTVYFLIPVYNEEGNIPALFNDLVNALQEENKFYLFVDDHSTDNTIDLIKKTFSNTSFTILEKEKNYGPGHSFNMGFEWILKNSADDSDIIVTMEADTTSDISILPLMKAVSDLGYELVLASVYAQGGGFERTNFFRKVISFFANMLFRFFYNVKVLTLSSFYRIYHISLLKKIKEKYPVLISENGFICMLEILMKAVKVEACIIEVPMKLKSDKREGTSKMKILKNMLQYFRFLFFKKL